jgi:hypothetical protein
MAFLIVMKGKLLEIKTVFTFGYISEFYVHGKEWGQYDMPNVDTCRYAYQSCIGSWKYRFGYKGGLDST